MPRVSEPTPNQSIPLELRRAGLEELIELRHEILRAGLPRESAIFEGDYRPDARHYGAFQDGRTVGCATLHVSQWEGDPAWQLRGMAVAKDLAGQGVGRAIVRFLEADVASTSAVHFLWCNARVLAAGFYEKQGWIIRSAPFEIPTAGPHVKMTRRLGAARAAPGSAASPDGYFAPDGESDIA